MTCRDAFAFHSRSKSLLGNRSNSRQVRRKCLLVLEGRCSCAVIHQGHCCTLDHVMRTLARPRPARRERVDESHRGVLEFWQRVGCGCLRHRLKCHRLRTTRFLCHASQPQGDVRRQVGDGRSSSNLCQDVDEPLGVLGAMQRMIGKKQVRSEVGRIRSFKLRKAHAGTSNFFISGLPHGLVRLSRLDLVAGECAIPVLDQYILMVLTKHLCHVLGVIEKHAADDGRPGPLVSVAASGLVAGVVDRGRRCWRWHLGQ